MSNDRAGAPGIRPLQPAQGWRNDSNRYSSPSIALHWLMLLLLVMVYATIELRGLFPKGSDPREAMKAWHFMLGLSVFVLVWLRLTIYALAGPAPSVQPEPPCWQALAAKAMHVALYVFMVVMPLLGWMILSAEGKPIPFFGLNLPALTGENKQLAGTVQEIHETVGEIGYWLIGLHAAAALLHHYFLRDNTLRRMLPARP
jgi:superoxide oxidase